MTGDEMLQLGMLSTLRPLQISYSFPGNWNRFQQEARSSEYIAGDVDIKANALVNETVQDSRV